MKPIIFSTPMVRAILAGRKSQTRRVVKPQPIEDMRKGFYAYQPHAWVDHVFMKHKPRYKPGDVLWVRETWGIGTRPDPSQGWVDGIEFKADEAFVDEIEGLPLYHTNNEKLFDLYANNEREGWHPSIHMPREAARLFLRVTDVRAERVQSIKAEDCVAEGAVKKPHYMRYGGEDCLVTHGRYKQEFSLLWDSINAKRGYGWDANPWVWVYTFERIELQEGKE